MAKVALTADWHARGSDLPAFQAQLAALVDECNSRGVDLLCVAGDVFDNSAIQDRHASTGAIARAINVELKRLDCKTDILIIPGNHDSAGAGSADALHIFDEAELTEVSHAPMWQIYGRLGLAVFCVPWDWSGAPFPNGFSPEGTMYEDAIGLASSKTMLLAHGEIIGTVMNGGAVCQANPGKFQVSRAELEAMPFDKIAFGHFHKRQGYFIGAIRQDDFGHEGEPAGFEIWDTETNVTEWIELDAAPRHTTIICDGNADNFVVTGARPGWLTKVKMTGAKPDLVLARDLERDGHHVEILPDMPERTARANVATNVINEPQALMALWAETNEIGGDRLACMLDSWDGLGADENETVEVGT